MGYTRSASTDDTARIRSVRLVLWVILGLNLAVAAAKYFYGLASGSISMQADGFHSLFDGTSNVIGLIGLAVAIRPPDRDHPYGHAKYETYAAAVIGAMLLLAAWKVGSVALARLTGGGEPPRIDAGSFVVMIATLVVNIGVATWERRMGKKLRSELLIADASHTGSDILVSVGVLVGLVAVRLGWPLADPLLALLVAAAIVWTAVQVLRQADLSPLGHRPPGDPGRLRGGARRPRGARLPLDPHARDRRGRPRGPAHPGRPGQHRGRGAPDRRGGGAGGLRALPRGRRRPRAPRAVRRVPGAQDRRRERPQPHPDRSRADRRYFSASREAIFFSSCSMTCSKVFFASSCVNCLR